MSCKACEEIQELNKRGDKCAYLRVGNANVLIGACDKHFNMLREQIGLHPQIDATVHRVINTEGTADSEYLLTKYDQWRREDK